MKVLDVVVTVLLIIGAVNWGLVGFFGLNVVSAIFGEAAAVSRVIYALIGLGGVYELFSVTFGYKAMHDRWCELSTVKH